MAITTAVTTTSSASWRTKDVSANDSNKFFDDQGQFLYSKAFTQGSGSIGEINLQWADRFTLISGVDTTLDLQNLSTSMFSTSITSSFTGLKDCLVVNNTTGVNSKISILSTGVNAFTTMWNNGSGNLEVMPNSALHFTAYTSGWAVTNINRNLIVRDLGGQGANLSIFFAGTSG